MSDDDDAPPPDSKLTRSKRQWAKEGRFLTGRQARPEAERLPPGQHPVRDWPVLDLGLRPDVPREDWRLRIWGLVQAPAVLDWAGLEALPAVETVTDIHCVTTWSRYDNHWTGVATRDLIAAVRPKAEAGFVVLHSFDGYTTNLTLEDFAAEDALLANGWEGRPLEARHGGPLRLVVPHLYFWKSAKWLRGIEFVRDDQPGYWEVRGYHNRGDPWREQRYSEDV
ncbi:MAG: oxidoreductase, molybdopterin binding [Caulobacter sp.]|nr:oxidoreductase, molybdopterin binding [Caulobacter sp.]